jgi:3-phytase
MFDKKWVRAVLAAGGAFALAGCIQTRVGVDAPGDPAKAVTAVVETIVTTDGAVDADDPELWADPRDPSRAVLFTADKSDGLYVHDLDGRVRQFLPDGPLNNVDLRTDFVVGGRAMVLVAASDRAQFGIRTYLFDPDSLETKPFGFIPTPIGEPYGFCLGKRGEHFYAIVNNKEGDILQVRINAGEGGPVGVIERRLKVATQPEGCVVDDDGQVLYMGEEDAAIWRFDFDPSGGAQPTLVARVDNRTLVADVEGLAIIRDADTKYLVASSQGDGTYPVYRIDANRYAYVGRFAVVDNGDRIDGVTGTDGLSAWSGPIGRFPEGLLAMHDEQDAPHEGQQNFKLVDWRAVKKALGLSASQSAR